MAHYAYLDENNIVVTVIVGRDENELIDGLDPEIYYAQGTPYTVKRTSFNNRIRRRFAGIGFSYDPVADVFLTPQPFASWTLDSNYDWQPPKQKPEGEGWRWDETKGDWVSVQS